MAKNFKQYKRHTCVKNLKWHLCREMSPPPPTPPPPPPPPPVVLDGLVNCLQPLFVTDSRIWEDILPLKTRKFLQRKWYFLFQS